jgi:hypothetical protein
VFCGVRTAFLFIVFLVIIRKLTPAGQMIGLQKQQHDHGQGMEK